MMESSTDIFETTSDPTITERLESVARCKFGWRHNWTPPISSCALDLSLLVVCIIRDATVASYAYSNDIVNLPRHLIQRYHSTQIQSMNTV